METNTSPMNNSPVEPRVITEEGNIKIVRNHKVGTITLGISLIFFGILFITKTFTQILTYEFILKLWPVIFIVLGFEVLISYMTNQKERFVYDKGAVFLMILLSMFAIVMACVEVLVDYSQRYMF